jgi:hypothetical protein
MEDNEKATALDGVKETAEGTVVNTEENIANQEKQEQEAVNPMQEFLSKPENREKARGDAFQLWTIVSQNSPIEKAAHMQFSRTQVVHRTTLSHKKAFAVLQLLSMFGYVKPVNKTDFKFTFEKEEQITYMKQTLSALTRAMNNDWQRFAAICDDKEMVEQTKSDIINAIFG